MLLLTLIIFSVVLVSFKRETLILDEVELREFTDNSTGLFAIMVEDDDGSYVEYTEDTFPTGMVFNSSMSNCINNNGETLIDVLSYDASKKTAVVDVGETIFCYLYFDNGSFSEYLISTSADSGGTDTTLIEHVEGCDNGCAEDGHYRYSGASDDVNNYICFGTSDLDTCLSDTDTYLFRIIEINPDDGAVKIIKATQLAGDDSYSSYSGTDNLYYWNGTDGSSNTPIGYTISGIEYYNYWALDTVFYSTLSDELNSTYLTIFTEIWQNEIISYAWKLGAFSLFPSSCSIDERTSKVIFDYESVEISNFQIGLMNTYDYGYAGSSSYWNTSPLCLNGSENWLYSGNIEWTIGSAKSSASTDSAYVVAISESGYEAGYYPAFASTANIRPVFYVDGNNLVYSSGTGTADAPYLITIN